jgi:hypothetical protein
MVSARRIGKRDVDALQSGQVIWDVEVSGFGARRQVGAVSRSDLISQVMLPRGGQRATFLEMRATQTASREIGRKDQIMSSYGTERPKPWGPC